MAKDSINAILKEGTLVYTKLSTSNIWHQNILYKVENKTLTIALLQGFLESIIMPGQNITIKYTTESMEYLYSGTIAEIQPQFPSHVKVNIVSVKELKNLRVFPRYDVYLAANIKYENTEEDYFSIIHDISLSGMSFYSRDIFAIDDRQLNITIYLPDKSMIIAKGNVIRKTDHETYSDYGLKYTDMQEENNNSLYSFFSKLEEKKSKIKDSFFTSIKRHLP